MPSILITISLHVTWPYNVQSPRAFHKCSTISSPYPSSASCYSAPTRLSAMTHRLHGREQLSRILQELQQRRKWEQRGSWQEKALVLDPYVENPRLDLSGHRELGRRGSNRHPQKKRLWSYHHLKAGRVRKQWEQERQRQRGAKPGIPSEKREKQTGNSWGWEGLILNWDDGQSSREKGNLTAETT